MKCPHCGSEDVQYVSDTSGGGMSCLSSCCGLVVPGPLGLLCGIEGSHTEEFWICHKCGEKFSKAEAKRELEREANAHKFYLESKKLKERIIRQYGSVDEVNKRLEVAKQEKTKRTAEYDAQFKLFVTRGDKRVKKQKKMADSDFSGLYNGMGISIIIGILLSIIGLLPLAVPFFGFAVIAFLYVLFMSMHAERKLEKMFIASSPVAKELYEKKEHAEKEYESWKDVKYRIDSCEKYEEEQHLKK